MMSKSLFVRKIFRKDYPVFKGKAASLSVGFGIYRFCSAGKNRHGFSACEQRTFLCESVGSRGNARYGYKIGKGKVITDF